MADNSFNNTVESLFKGMDSFITTKTVVGDAIHIGDTIILPLVDVSFGVAAGAFSAEKKNNGNRSQRAESALHRNTVSRKMSSVSSVNMMAKQHRLHPSSPRSYIW